MSSPTASSDILEPRSGTALHESTWRRWCCAYDLARLAVALLLCAAAYLKAHHFLSTPPPTLLQDRHWLAVSWPWAQVALEWLLGLWMLGAWQVRFSRSVAIVCFAGFAVVTAIKALAGERSCGCFGAVQVNPWLTLAIDLAALAALILLRPSPSRMPQASRRFMRRWITGTSLVAATVVAGVALALSRPVPLGQDGLVPADARHVILLPQQWIGQALPLRHHLPPASAEQLMQGRWLVLLYHHDCPNCQQTMIDLADWHSSEDGDGEDERQLALIQVPPTGELDLIELLDTPPPLQDQLPEDKDWIVQTPVFLWLDAGQVQRVTDRPEADGSGSSPGESVSSSTTSPATSPAATQPVQASGLQHDLGYVRPSSRHIVRYAVKNPLASQALAIRGVVSECRCMSVPAPPSSIDDGGSAWVDVLLESPEKPTDYSKRIFVLPAVAGVEPIELRLSARIGLPLRVEPKSLELVEVQLGQTITKTVAVYNDGEKPVRLLYATSSIPGCVIKVPRDPISPGGSIELSAKITATQKWTQQDEVNVQLHTSEPNQPSLQLSICR